MKPYLIVFFALFISTSNILSQPTGDIPLDNLEIDNATKYTIKDSDKITIPPLVDLSENMPEVGNQGDLQSCAAWATTYYLRSYYNNIQNGNTQLEPFSQMFIYRLYTNRINKGVCKGFVTAYLLDSVITNGAIPYGIMPYRIENCNSMPSENLELAKSYSMKNYKTKIVRKSIKDFKILLSRGTPIVASINVDDNFRQLTKRNSIQSEFDYDNFDKNRSYHAIVIVGYDESIKAFKVINSWGKKWGDNGFGWIDEKVFYSVFNYGCIINRYKNIRDIVIENPKLESSSLLTEQPSDNTFSSWFKEGYFREYQEFNTRIVLKDMNKKEKLALIELKEIDTGNKIKEVYLKKGETNEFNIPDLNYEVSITFEKIAKAGKNPFKKAVYYELEFKELKELKEIKN